MHICLSLFFLVISLLFIFLGFSIRKKQNLQLVHSYHHTKVKKEDVPAYCRGIGISLLVLANGLLISAILALFSLHSLWGLLLALHAACAIVLFVRTQKKYNKGVF